MTPYEQGYRTMLEKLAVTTYYHGTRPSQLEQIEAEGLDPQYSLEGKEAPLSRSDNWKPYVSLTTQPRYARRYAQAGNMDDQESMLARLKLLFRNNPELLQVDLPDDFEVESLGAGRPIMGIDESRVYDTIPPEYISRYKEGAVTTDLMPHQQRVVDRLQTQPGLLVAHGLGTGKTLSSIAAADATDGSSQALVPASLIANYEKEVGKHTDQDPGIDVRSAQGAALRNEVSPTDLLILDEAHRARETSTKLNQLLRNYPAKKRMFLTATPVYNRPSDIAPLVNLVAQDNVLPTGGEFNKKFIQRPSRSLMRAWLGGNTKSQLKNTGELQQSLNDWVDYQTLEGGDFPERIDESTNVPMSKEQTKLHDFAWGKLPLMARMRLKAGLPPNKQDMSSLNAFQSQARQVGGSTKRFSTEEETPLAPKLEKALADLQSDEGRAVVYSNYLDTLGDYSKGLEAANIPHGVYSGQVSQKKRKQMIEDYNAGKLRALLLSSAGGEGLDLKGTRQLQVLEPHWNEEKLEQVIGRAIRHGSHADLPEDERNVKVRRYLTHPRPGIIGKMLGQQPRGVEQVLADKASDKRELNQQLLALMENQQ